MDEVSQKENISNALIKKAMGLCVDEVVEEYSKNSEDETMELVKRKVTKKQLPPDMQAVKTLLEYYNLKDNDMYSNMTDEELIKERDKLLKILQNEEDKDANNET